MARSAGLSLLLASRGLAGGGKPKISQRDSAPAPRPDGELVWYHAGPGTRPQALAELARRCASARPGSTALLTSEAPVPVAEPLLSDDMPDDSQRAVRRFLDHWRPDTVVLGGELIYPTFIVEAHDRGMAVCLVDATIPQTLVRRLRWAPGAAAAFFGCVRHVLTPSEAEAETFRRFRTPRDRVEAVGTLDEGTAPLPCNRSDHSAISRLIAARPVWLAIDVQPDEIEDVLAAHDRARRTAHRLLLLLCPADTASGPELRDMLESRGWKVALRSDGEEPDPDIQIFVADTPGEAGLWYRLAPITFLGGSLGRMGTGRDPHEPAALGSAILTGRRTGSHRDAVSRFLKAGAARTVGSGEALGEAVTDLLSPDRAAEMARRAWEITSAGAEVTDRALDIILTALDERGMA